MTKTNKSKWHLRITLLPQCNFRCIYCNPNGVFEKAEILKFDEILEIVKAAVACGINRVHWTGGEPCMLDVCNLFEEARKLGMVEQIMTTNGSLRLDEVENMKKAGLDRVNISLDTLDPDLNQVITGKNLFDTTVSWIEKATSVFDVVTKMNVVPMRENLHEIPDFIHFAEQFNGKLMLKFIELCPNNPAFYNDEIHNHFVSRQDLLTELFKVGSLQMVQEGVGDNPNAEYYFVGNTGVTVILISMPSQNFKCGLDKCWKLRVSPFGVIGSCINQSGDKLLGLSFEEKVDILKKRMKIRELYSNIPPVDRKHKRADFGIWRFGIVGQQTEGCTRC